MGLFGAIKTIIKFRKELKKSIVEAKENEARYLAMSVEELSALSDDELFDAVDSRVENRIDGYKKLEEGFAALNEPQKIFCSLKWMQAEVDNGGLCQFFVNSSRLVAPLVSEYMGIVGANEHKGLYDAFVEKNGIDLSDFSFFDIVKIEEFEEKAQKYPFDEYDDAFYGMEPLENYLKKYIRDNLENL